MPSKAALKTSVPGSASTENSLNAPGSASTEAWIELNREGFTKRPREYAAVGGGYYAPGSASAALGPEELCNDLAALSLTQLRKRARATPGIKEKNRLQGNGSPKIRRTSSLISKLCKQDRATSAQACAAINQHIPQTAEGTRDNPV